jgi:hypothetical protein
VNVLERTATLHASVSKITGYSYCLDFGPDGSWFGPYKPAAEKETIYRGKMGAVSGGVSSILLEHQSDVRIAYLVSGASIPGPLR